MEKNLLHVLKLSKIYQEGNGVKKKLQLTSLLGLSLFIMTACATNGTTSDITADSTDFWSKFVYFFAEIIRFCPLTLVSEWGLSLHDFDPDDSITGLSGTDGCL